MSFFQREKQHILPIAVFGGLAAFICVAAGSLIIKALSGGRAPINGAAESSAVFEETPEVVVKQYKKDLQTLQDSLKKYSGSREEFFAFAENALLVMRVPKEMLDPHIAAVLKVRNLRAAAPNSNERATAQDEVTALVSANETAYE